MLKEISSFRSREKNVLDFCFYRFFTNLGPRTSRLEGRRKIVCVARRGVARQPGWSMGRLSAGTVILQISLRKLSQTGWTHTVTELRVAVSKNVLTGTPALDPWNRPIADLKKRIGKALKSIGVQYRDVTFGIDDVHSTLVEFKTRSDIPCSRA